MVRLFCIILFIGNVSVFAITNYYVFTTKGDKTIRSRWKVII